MIKYVVWLVQIIMVCSRETVVSRQKNRTVISFGSCFKMFDFQSSEIFRSIAEQNSDVFIWLGDAAYIDYMVFPFVWRPLTDDLKIEKRFNLTKNDANYRLVLESGTRILGVYDDHDFNSNDGNKEFKYKEKIKHHYLNFIDEKEDSERRKQKGIYASYYLENSNNHQQRVKIVLLDTRFNKDQTEKEGDMLGMEQWEWLENEFEIDNKDIHILVSGTQFMADDRIMNERWYLWSKNKILSLIGKYQIRAFFLSGDVHFAEIFKHPCTRHYLGYDIQEITSSGLTHTVHNEFPLFELFNPFIPETYSSIQDRQAVLNYGLIEIEWLNNDTSVPVDQQLKIVSKIRGIENQLLLQTDIEFGQHNTTKQEKQFWIPDDCVAGLSVKERIMDIYKKQLERQNYRYFMNLVLGMCLFFCCLGLGVVQVIRLGYGIQRYIKKALGYDKEYERLVKKYKIKSS